MSKILLVEDDEFLAQLYQSQLNSQGFSVEWVSTAQAAIDWLDEHNAEAVLLDIALPSHNGVEVLNELQSHSDWQKLPVIVMSSQPKNRFGKIDWAGFGVQRYIYKPELDITDLARQVRAVMS